MVNTTIYHSILLNTIVYFHKGTYNMQVPQCYLHFESALHYQGMVLYSDVVANPKVPQPQHYGLVDGYSQPCPSLMKIYHSKCMVYHGVLKQVNHGKYHGILWNTMVYFHKAYPISTFSVLLYLIVQFVDMILHVPKQNSCLDACSVRPV